MPKKAATKKKATVKPDVGVEIAPIPEVEPLPEGKIRLIDAVQPDQRVQLKLRLKNDQYTTLEFGFETLEKVLRVLDNPLTDEYNALPRKKWLQKRPRRRYGE